MSYTSRRKRVCAVAILAGSVLLGSATSAEPPRPTSPAASIQRDVTRVATKAQRDSVYRLYRAYFLREPDSHGITYWSERLANGRSTLAAIAQFFSESPEFRQRYGALSNADFVRLIYSNVLQRNADGSGVDFWVRRLNQGTSRGSIMIGFSESIEFQRLTDTLPPIVTPPARSWENEILGLLNAERARAGRAPLTLCQNLINAAQGQANYLAANQILTHIGSGQSTFDQRIDAAGYHWSAAGENVAMSGTNPSPANVLAMWMASSQHQGNLLNSAFEHVGFARATASNGYLYWAQDFGAGGKC